MFWLQNRNNFFYHTLLFFLKLCVILIQNSGFVFRLLCRNLEYETSMQAEQITKLKEDVQKIRHEKEELLIRYDLFSKQKMTEIPQTQIIIVTNKVCTRKL